MPDDARTLSMVTIFFEAEIGLLRLQARSLRLMADPDLFQQIIVIDNTRRGMSSRSRHRVDHEFGPWSRRVEYLRPDDIARLPDRMPGWVNQQVLKLAVHKFVRSVHYVVLDAKNVWNQQTGLDTFVAPDGRARGASHTYRGHALEHRVEGVLRYMDVDPEPWIDHFPVTHTPVVLERQVVGELVRHVEATGGVSFAEEFLRAGLLEFPLYAAYLIARFGTPTGHLDGTVVRSTTIWPSMDAHRFVAELRDSRSIDSPFLAVHRKALARATPFSARALADLWVEKGLFASRARALYFIGWFKVHYARTMSMRRVHEQLGSWHLTKAA